MSRTIIFQPSNHVGLGHISRLIAVALAVRHADPTLRLPFVVDGNGHGLVEAHGLAHMSLPSGYEIHETAAWTIWEPAERFTILTSLALALVRALQPNLIVFDCFPNMAVVKAAITCQVPMALCVRKMKDMDRYFERLKAMQVPLELVLIAHDEGACPVPDEVRTRARFIGPVVRRTEATSVSSTDSLAGPLVVISGGGGGYPGTVDFYNLALAGFERARRHTPDLAALLVAGPLFTEWRQLRLVDGVRVVPFDPRLSDLFASADVIVCQAGYNTVAEVLSSGVPTICVPAPRGADDQFERAALAATSPTFRTYEGSDAIAFGQLLLDAIAAGRTASSPPPVTLGATRAAEHLLGLLAR